ncbi:F-box protein CPR1-like [Cornus florida]|uniref:F-box protein CPR1-like n=1 Tax=Cornus florida TaxID=4283 RepID=UPI0028A2A7D4|nr:F-box protein CPR1-like [Cornus florida]
MEENRYLILSFDMASEVFGEMVLPGCVANGIGLQMSISVFGESLSLFEYDSFGGCSIWVMKEYGIAESWTKLFSFKSYIRKVLGFRKNGEIVAAKSYINLVSFDPKSKQEVNLGMCRSKYKYSSLIRRALFYLMEKIKAY